MGGNLLLGETSIPVRVFRLVCRREVRVYGNDFPPTLEIQLLWLRVEIQWPQESGGEVNVRVRMPAVGLAQNRSGVKWDEHK